MTTVISRLYADADTADAVVSKVRDIGISARDIDVLSKSGADNLATAIEAAQVDGDAAARYAAAMDANSRLVVVRAGFNPVGAALQAIGIADAAGPVDAGIENENVYRRSEMRPDYRRSSVMKDSPRFLTGDLTWSGTVSEQMGWRLLRPHRERRSVIHGGRFMSKRILPFPLLSKKRRKSSVISGGRHMSTRLMPFPLLSKHKDRLSVVRGGSLPFAAIFGAPTLIKKRER